SLDKITSWTALRAASKRGRSHYVLRLSELPAIQRIASSQNLRLYLYLADGPKTSAMVKMDITTQESCCTAS
ncbi:MAG: hypothetical protein P9L91_04915, partial [Candidatus Zophobacter franzmannii]|nr:hypothetical protein [Candidatus Zophobacter franzmannii]